MVPVVDDAGTATRTFEKHNGIEARHGRRMAGRFHPAAAARTHTRDDGDTAICCGEWHDVAAVWHTVRAAGETHAGGFRDHRCRGRTRFAYTAKCWTRSEEHTSELQ